MVHRLSCVLMFGFSLKDNILSSTVKSIGTGFSQQWRCLQFRDLSKMSTGNGEHFCCRVLDKRKDGSSDCHDRRVRLS